MQRYARRIPVVMAVAVVTALVLAAGCQKESGGPRPPSSDVTAPTPRDEATSGEPADGPNRQQGGIEVLEPWSKFTGTMLGAYMKIVNHGQEPDAVIGVRAPSLGKASLHRSTMEGDMAKMQPVDRIELPAGATIELKEGGYHVMVEVPQDRHFKAGDAWELILVLQRGGEIGVEVPVKEVGGGEMEQSHGERMKSQGH